VSDARSDDQVCGTCGQSDGLVPAKREPSHGELEALDAESLDRALQLLTAAELENGEPMSGQVAWFHLEHVPPGWHHTGGWDADQNWEAVVNQLG
jgi:hypothetical protein